MKVTLGIAARAGLFLVAGVWAAACGDDSTGGPGPGAGTGAGGAAGTAGSAAAGGSSAAGGRAGMLAAGSGGGLTCASATMGAPAALHAAAVTALLPTAANKGCAFSSCHDANAKKANLTLTETPADLRLQLVGKAACEVPTYPLVDTSGGDTALQKSWLWQKLVAPANSSGEITAKPEWGTAAPGCGQMSGAGFGLRMPYSGTDMLLTPQSKLEAIRDWICAGAPGPN